MKFIVIDNEKFAKLINSNPCYTNFSVEVETDSLEGLIEKVKEIKPHAEKVQMEYFKAQGYCEIAGIVIATDNKISIHKIE